ncbi:heme utilization cystosolic carrier protein HutX [Phreatobacter sp.]|uniref:heme utilization cystosolic carrier protein HutX n=1 Tax=Phreatobacter sp. TaxID=1966341 RepID=UPI003F70AD13
MSAQIIAFEDRLSAARAALAAKPDGVIENVAREHGLPPREVLAMLPPGEAVSAPPAAFEAIWTDVTTWGEVLFIVNTPDIVLECHGPLVPGSSGHGWFNVHGDSPIGGHIKASNCQEICFVDRKFHGRRSLSIQFFNAAGEAMFKIFVRRDKARDLMADQVLRFEALRTTYL